jgi:glycosyltransferase involved in cell wall biosynthesis
MHVCSLVTASHLAYAQVLADSVHAHEPDAVVTILVLDDELPDHDGRDWRAISPRQLDLGEDEFRVMASIYDAYELSCALKPWLIRSVLEHEESTLFLDSDMLVLGPLTEVFDRARRRPLVLTPHLIEPPAPANEPSELWILLAGTFNLGFMAASRGAMPFLDWWSAHLRRDCLDDADGGFVVDQRWVALAPGYFDIDIWRDPAWNCAYWRLADRPIAFDGRVLLVDGQPVTTFHFSGFDPVRPQLLTWHLQHRPSVLLSENPSLAAFCELYRDRLLAAGHETHRLRSYGFGRLAAGLELDRLMRRAYRRGVLEAEADGMQPPPGPFDADGGAAFVAWLRDAPDRRRSARVVSRYLTELHRTDLTVSDRFPDLVGADAERLVEWAGTDGVEKHGLEPTLACRAASPWTSKRAPATKAGINFVWPSGVGFGLNEAARLLRLGVAASGVECVDIVPDEARSGIYPSNDWVAERSTCDINLWAVNAAQLAAFFHEVGTMTGHDRHTIAYWWWELGTFPSHRFDADVLAQEIWVGTDFVRDAITAAIEIPVFTVPIPIAPPPPPSYSRAAFGLPDDAFVFLFVFDFGSSFVRKNPLALVDAYCRAFGPDDGAVLVVKGAAGERYQTARERLFYAARGREDVRVIDERYSAEKLVSLLGLCDAYASLHHSEGLGLTMAEAMAIGKPVIATGYSGNLSFMTEANSYLVRWRPGVVPKGAEPYPAGAFWADPDLDHAAELLRHVFTDRKDALLRAERARRDVEHTHSLERSAAAISRRIVEIRESGSPFLYRG